MLIDPRGDRVSGNPGAGEHLRQSIRSGFAAGYDGVGALVGAPTETTGYLESSGCHEYGSSGDGAGTAVRYE